MKHRKRACLWALGIALVVAASLLTLEGAIRLSARRAGNRAAERFGGGRIAGLAALVGCQECPLHDRDMAVWALGELGDPGGLPALRAYYTGEKCDHRTKLCQYELGKAIRKLEGRWGLHASLTFGRSRP